MIGVYVAGAMRDPDAARFLGNLQAGISMGAKLAKMGYSPFCPMLDHQYFLQDPTIPIKTVKAVSVEWLTKCDAVLVLPGWQNSEGVKNELLVADDWGIPVFFILSDLESFFATKRREKYEKCRIREVSKRGL